MLSYFKNKSLHIFLLVLVAITFLVLSLALLHTAHKTDRVNTQRILAEVKAISTSVIDEASFNLDTFNNNQPDFIILPDSKTDDNKLYLVADSNVFGTRTLYYHNNQFYGRVRTNKGYSVLFPIKKISRLYLALTGNNIIIVFSNNFFIPSNKYFFLTSLYNLSGVERAKILVQGEKKYFTRVTSLTVPLLIIFFILLYLLSKHYIKPNEKQDVSPTPHRTNEIDLLKGIGIGDAIKNLSSGIRIIDRSFNVLFINRAFERLTSIKYSHTNNKACYDSFGSIFCHTGECPIISISSAEKELLREEVRYLPDGKKIHIELHAYPLVNANGEVIAVVEEIKDITTRHNIEEELRQSENQFKVFIDSLPFGVYIEDGIANRIIFQNNYLKQLTRGKDFNDFIKQYQSKIGEGYPNESEIHLTLENGSTYIFSYHTFKFTGVQNRIRIGAILIDITRKKEVEHYRDVLSKAIEFTPVSIIILSPHFEFEFINPNFTELTGYSIDTLYSKSILEIGLEVGSHNYIEKALNKVKAEENWQGELQIRGKNGQKNWVSASFSPVISKEGDLQHILAIFENITRRKEYETELLLAKTKAEESDKLKSNFLNNISHEIRTPLNAIIGFSSFLSDESISPQERSGFSEYIYKNSQELLRIIENILEISQIEAGEISISHTEFSVNSLLSDIFREFDEIERGDSPIRLSLRKEVQENDLIILSDPIRLKQVLKQLLSNSFKFTPNGFVEFGYRLKDEKTLMFYVIDSGIGIDQDKINYIFNPFRQADDSNTRQHGGLGLGLAISKHIVERLGGKIWINSLLGSGTSVFFTIPFIPVRMKFDNTSQNNLIATFDWNGKTILIADDIDANYVYFRSLLQKTKAKLIWARNGLEAINIIKSNHNVDLVLMDLVMPDMDGFEATRQIKSFRNDLPVVGQTAYPEKVNRGRLADFGFDSMLEKPIKPQQMLFIIDKFLVN